MMHHMDKPFTVTLTGTLRQVMTVFLLGTVFSVMCCPEPVQAQGKGSRPRVGVVLSGGGARGAAHVGVLRVLEELRIPVDCIAGTSMGAIVGGLYAMGMPVDELERMTTQVDWNEIFTDDIPRSSEVYRRKSDRNYYLSSIDFDLEHGVRLPMGIITGKRIDLFLRSLALNAPDDFDTFPIPFRAVASDIVTGQQVVLSKGDLARSLMASMAIPGAIAPVEIDGRLLVDGGVTQNLPIDVVREMGADVVIAVNIGTPLSREENLTSFLSVLDQTTNILTNRNVFAQVYGSTAEGVVIEPVLGDITTASFERMHDAVRAGERAAMDRADELERYAVEGAVYDRHRQDRMSRARPVPRIEFVKMEQRSFFGSDALLRLIGIRAQGVMQKQILARDIFQIYKRDDLEDIDFEVIEQDGKNGLLIKARERGRTRHTVDLGIELSSDLDNDNSYRLLLKYTMSGLNALGGEWKNEIHLGQNERYFTEFYQPLSPYAWRLFVAPYAEYRDNVIDLYERYDAGNPFATYDIQRTTLGMDIGIQMAEYGEFRFGYAWGRSKSALDTGFQALPEEENDEGAYRLMFVFDQLDSPFFPRDGMRFSSTYHYSRKNLGADDDFETLECAFTGAVSHERHALTLRARGDTNFDTARGISRGFYLGGLFNLSGLNTDQLYGNHVTYGGIIYSYRILDLFPLLGKGLYAGVSLESGNAWPARDDVDVADIVTAGSFFIALDSRLGPAYIGYGLAERGVSAAYFSLGAIRF